MTIVRYGMQEALRRKVFLVVLLLTALFLVLYWLVAHFTFRDLASISPPRDAHVDTRTFAGAFLFGLAMFATLFLGVVLAVFLTLGAVSGDAERGLLQPLVVRPIGRGQLLVSLAESHRGPTKLDHCFTGSSATSAAGLGYVSARRPFGSTRATRT